MADALTPAEWATRRVTRDGVTITQSGSDLFLSVGVLTDLWLGDLAPALAALANAARDDDDPAKLTRRMVEACELGARLTVHPDEPEPARALRELAAALRAILPYEG